MIVFALRHADRKPEPADELSEAGKQRAELLARMLKETGIRTAYCSSKIRTQQTMAPLKALLGARLEVLVVVGSDQTMAAIKALPADAVAAVVGHSDTVRPIVKGLTGRDIDPIEAHQFDKLFVLSIAGAGTATVAAMRYGNAS